MENVSVCSREVAARSGEGRELCQRAGSPLPKCLCSAYGRKLGLLLSFLPNPRFWKCEGVSLTLVVCWKEHVQDPAVGSCLLQCCPRASSN